MSAAERWRDEKSRLMPLLVAGVFCFFVAVILGYGSWRLFGSHARKGTERAGIREILGFGSADQENPESKTSPQEAIQKPEVPRPEKPVDTTPKLEGVVPVAGGETVVGGGDSKRPLKRVFVDDFLISETEVTNEEYSEFVGATGYRPPNHWQGRQVPPGMERFPVVNVSVDDAVAFCSWKSKETGMEVRLPSYAEWERAAAGSNRFKYPWGNEWNEAAISSEKNRRPFPVKSFELNRSPFGAFDMVGNVWEWTADTLSKNELASDKAVKEFGPDSRIHLVLGGSYNEDRNKLANSFWAEIESRTRVKSVGFRYVIIPESNKTRG